MTAENTPGATVGGPLYGARRGILQAMRILIGLFAMSIATLTACSSGDGDDAQPKELTTTEWRDALADVGINPPDWDRYVASVKDTCALDNFKYYVTFEGADLASTRIGLQGQCPERLDEWDKAVVDLQDINARVDYLCNTPRGELAADDRDEADAIC